jgi:hypothetical protein
MTNKSGYIYVQGNEKKRKRNVKGRHCKPVKESGIWDTFHY